MSFVRFLVKSDFCVCVVVREMRSLVRSFGSLITTVEYSLHSPVF